MSLGVADRSGVSWRHRVVGVEAVRQSRAEVALLLVLLFPRGSWPQCRLLPVGDPSGFGESSILFRPPGETWSSVAREKPAEPPPSRRLLQGDARGPGAGRQAGVEQRLVVRRVPLQVAGHCTAFHRPTLVERYVPGRRSSGWRWGGRGRVGRPAVRWSNHAPTPSPRWPGRGTVPLQAPESACRPDPRMVCRRTSPGRPPQEGRVAVSACATARPLGGMEVESLPGRCGCSRVMGDSAPRSPGGEYRARARSAIGDRPARARVARPLPRQTPGSPPGHRL